MRGYINAIESMKKLHLRKDGQTDIFKLVINNNSGRRVRICCWGQDATKWSAKITINRVSFLSLSSLLKSIYFGTDLIKTLNTQQNKGFFLI